jgi:hypothetical protein
MAVVESLASLYIRNGPGRSLCGRKRKGCKKFQDIRVVVGPLPVQRHRVLPVHCFQPVSPVSFPIDYSYYVPWNVAAPVSGDVSECLHGVLHYIFFHSGNHHNLTELQVACTGKQPTSQLDSLFNLNSSDVFTFGDGHEHSIEISFSRIQVRPTALAQAWAPQDRVSRPPYSYVFEGWNAWRQKWIVLFERSACSHCGPNRWCRVDPIDTDHSFAKFRFRPTYTTLPPGLHIAISKFEIHGQVHVTDLATHVLPESEVTMDTESEFDPWKIPEFE